MLSRWRWADERRLSLPYIRHWEGVPFALFRQFNEEQGSHDSLGVWDREPAGAASCCWGTGRLIESGKHTPRDASDPKKPSSRPDDQRGRVKLERIHHSSSGCKILEIPLGDPAKSPSGYRTGGRENSPKGSSSATSLHKCICIASLPQSVGTFRD